MILCSHFVPSRMFISVIQGVKPQRYCIIGSTKKDKLSLLDHDRTEFALSHVNLSQEEGSRLTTSWTHMAWQHIVVAHSTCTVLYSKHTDTRKKNKRRDAILFLTPFHLHYVNVLREYL